MVKRDMKKALGASLKAEEQAVKSRFAKAKTVPSEKSPEPRAQTQPEAAVQVSRDSFTIPGGGDELISRIRRRCMKAGINANRNDVLRAGLAALDTMRDREFERLFERSLQVRTSSRRRECVVFILHRADTFKLRRPFQLKRFQFTRQVLIGHKIATITGEI